MSSYKNTIYRIIKYSLIGSTIAFILTLVIIIGSSPLMQRPASFIDILKFYLKIAPIVIIIFGFAGSLNSWFSRIAGVGVLMSVFILVFYLTPANAFLLYRNFLSVLFLMIFCVCALKVIKKYSLKQQK